MGFKLNISNKQDWITKCENKIDTQKYKVTYDDLSKKSNFKKFDAVIPLFETDVLHLNKINASQYKNFIVPLTETVKLCEDKKKFYDFMVQNGFSNYTPQISDKLSPPYILKKRIDEWGQNAFVIKNHTEEEAYLTQLNSDEFFKQEYFFGKEEYTTHFIFHKNEFKYLFNLKFEFKKDCYVKGMQTPPFKNAVITQHQTLYEEILKEILMKLNFEGVGCFNYKIHDDIPKIFEINPRVGGSLPLDVNRFLEAYISTINSEKNTFSITKFLRSIFSYR